jgi:hypothetical protein
MRALREFFCSHTRYKIRAKISCLETPAIFRHAAVDFDGQILAVSDFPTTRPCINSFCAEQGEHEVLPYQKSVVKLLNIV